MRPRRGKIVEPKSTGPIEDTSGKSLKVKTRSQATGSKIPDEKPENNQEEQSLLSSGMLVL